jgi:hypothetical protein
VADCANGACLANFSNWNAEIGIAALKAFRFALAFAVFASAETWAQSASLDDREMAVLSKAISTRISGSEKWLLIANDTSTFRCDGISMIHFEGCDSGMRLKEQRPEDVMAWLRARLPIVSPELLIDFRNKSEYPAKVGRPFAIKIKQTVWGPVGDSWEVVAGEKLPEAPFGPDYLITVSRVGFDPNGNEALVYVGAISWTDSKLSFGEYIYLLKDGNGWAVKRRVRPWDRETK